MKSKKMTKKLALLLALLLALSILAGCGQEQEREAEDLPETVMFTDSLGREVELDSKIEKIAVSGPLAQIVLYSLAPEMLVGFSSDWSSEAAQYIPEEYFELPVLGQLYGGKGELNLEELLLADPQVVIDVGEPKDSAAEDLNALQEQTGIPFVHITATTETMSDAYRMLGELLGIEERAEEYAVYCEEVYENTKNIIASVGEDNKIPVLYCLGDQGINVIAKGSYHAEIIDLLSDNLAVVEEPSAKGSGNEVDMEQILIWNPEVIFFAPDSIYSEVENDSAWQRLTAIQNGKYYEVPFGPYNWMGFPPSVQRYLGMIWMAQILYPDTAQYDVKAEAKRYYEMFYHTELSDAQYDALVANSLGKIE